MAWATSGLLALMFASYVFATKGLRKRAREAETIISKLHRGEAKSHVDHLIRVYNSKYGRKVAGVVEPVAASEAKPVDSPFLLKRNRDESVTILDHPV